nr:nucleotidyltransferase domain-containing protein [Anaerolineae bacterium]
MAPEQRSPVAPIGFPPVTEERLQEMVQRIVEAFDPERIILFGSYASGEPTPHSDVDLLIVMEDGDRPARRSARIARVLLDVPFPIDILVRTPTELQHRLHIGDYFIQEILERGRVLYERD